MLPVNRERLKMVLRGAVQGVGFRPFVYRLATELKLQGWVSNSGEGVLIESEGARDALNAFLLRIEKEKPARSTVYSLESSFLDPIGYRTFEIRTSEDDGDKSVLIPPDIATCPDCLREILDPGNRRFRYPFTNCTNCGPRFSIIEELPYDRANTSMEIFKMCAECEREYRDPLDRRFHAQPNACPSCGPQLELWDENGAIISQRDEALEEAALAVRAGRILALKGLGGFQLVVDARNETAIARLRERKQRAEKPFALLYPSFNVVHADCQISELEQRLLLSPESPIVLLTRRQHSQLAPSVAPRNPSLGAMLPYTPLHHLLLRELDSPVVATSGNLSDEPICIEEHEALNRLRGIADLFLVHDRPIVRHMDDSIVRVMCGRELVLRRARGYAPLPIATKLEDRRIILGVGAHLKNTVALKNRENIFVSQHVGDLETKQAYNSFCRAARDLPRLYVGNIDVIACDTHPDYLSTKFAGQSGVPTESIQHHWAHICACIAENEIAAPALGVAWDGTGYGLDGTIWGGEFLLAKKNGSFDRVAHLRAFPLPGGDAAMREPRRSAVGLLYEIFGDDCWNSPFLDFNETEKAVLRRMLEKKINVPLTSSAGRLFDAVAALSGLRQCSSFEGQAAMELEFAIRQEVRGAYPFALADAATPMIVDWEPAIRELLTDVRRGEEAGLAAAKFHNMLVEAIVAVARKLGEKTIVLSGGCLQNRYLTERAVERLREENFRPYWHQRIPPNDGGIALGQVVAASWSGQ